MTQLNPDVPHRREVETRTNVVAPTDQIRWGPILAGLFTAISTLTVLSVLGLAIGLTAWDANDPARTFGIAAGWWGGISSLIAFFVGGWIAARGAAFRGSRSALLNSAMVWAVAIPLLLYFIGSGLSTALTSAARTAAPADLRARVEGAPQMRDFEDAQSAAARLSQQVTPGAMEEAAGVGAASAWWTLLALILGFAAAITGGYIGSQGFTASTGMGGPESRTATV